MSSSSNYTPPEEYIPPIEKTLSESSSDFISNDQLNKYNQSIDYSNIIQYQEISHHSTSFISSSHHSNSFSNNWFGQNDASTSEVLEAVKMVVKSQFFCYCGFCCLPLWIYNYNQHKNSRLLYFRIFAKINLILFCMSIVLYPLIAFILKHYIIKNDFDED